MLVVTQSAQALTVWDSYSTGLNQQGIAYGNGIFVGEGVIGEGLLASGVVGAVDGTRTEVGEVSLSSSSFVFC